MREVGTIIIGGGISGATALHSLASSGKDVLLLERSNVLGGAMQSNRNEFGALIERGPNSIQSGNNAVERLIEELGLTGELIEADTAAANRYVLRNGELVAVPGNPRALIETPLLSGGAKLRLLREVFVKPAPDGREESVADFVRRRLGREPLDYGVNPFVSGIYAGRPENLSLRYAFPMLYELERKHGSLIRGILARMKERKRQAKKNENVPKKPRRRMFSFREGIAALPNAIGEKWREHILTNAEVSSIEENGFGWNVIARVDGREETFRAKNLIVGTNAIVAADLLKEVDPDLTSVLRKIEYPPVAVLTLLYDRSAVTHPLDGFGLLIPEVERRDVLGVIFSSSIFPTRAPEDSVLLTVFVGGARQPELALQPLPKLQQMVIDELRYLLGAAGNPRSVDVALWKNAIPQYNLGYGEILEGIAAAEKRHPGLHLLGNYRGGISVPDCIQAGRDQKLEL